MPESYRNNSTVYTSLFTSWQESVPRLLDATGLPDRLAAEKRIIIKPNLVEPLKPPITTPVELIATLVDFIHASLPHLEIIIGEGCGSSSNNTWQIFDTLGYSKLADRTGVTLLVNQVPGIPEFRETLDESGEGLWGPGLLSHGLLLGIEFRPESTGALFFTQT